MPLYNPAASGLQSDGAVVNISESSSPTTGQVLVATSPSTAVWGDSSALIVRASGTFSEVVADTTTTSTSWVPLLSTNVTTSNTTLLITCVVSVSNAVANRWLQFKVTVDGVDLRGCGIRPSAVNLAESGGFQATKGVLSGSHDVVLWWRVQTTSTGQVRPVTHIEECASLLIQEFNE